MKKLFLLGLFCIAVFTYFSCAKTDNPQMPACTDVNPNVDSSTIIKFANDSFPNAVPLSRDSSGLYYHIIDPGSSSSIPTFESNLMVTYIARFIPSNIIFDSATNSNLNGAQLGNLIYGWQIGLPKIGVGGHIQLFIPSAYAWGCAGYGTIPSDAPVFFDIKLLAVH
jgi:FKBP-type peptidyl-prolyl cis-trans isomerase FkpA